jgi:hypothetical protein
MQWLVLLAAISIVSPRGENWQKVAFIGDADVKSISGVVEVITDKEQRILHEREVAKVGQTLRIWRGAEVILHLKNSKSLVRAKGPALLRLAPETEKYERASLTDEEPKTGFVVRAVRGHGKFQDGRYWRDVQPGMTIAEGAKVRPFRDSTLDFYHPATRTAYRVTDHRKQTTLVAQAPDQQGIDTLLAAKAP